MQHMAARGKLLDELFEVAPGFPCSSDAHPRPRPRTRVARRTGREAHQGAKAKLKHRARGVQAAQATTSPFEAGAEREHPRLEHGERLLASGSRMRLTQSSVFFSSGGGVEALYSGQAHEDAGMDRQQRLELAGVVRAAPRWPRRSAS